jgi:hypothetical protein
MQKFDKIDELKEMQETIKACKTYFDFCKFHPITANHDSSESDTMQTRLRLRREAERLVDGILFH